MDEGDSEKSSTVKKKALVKKKSLLFAVSSLSSHQVCLDSAGVWHISNAIDFCVNQSSISTCGHSERKYSNMQNQFTALKPFHGTLIVKREEKKRVE